MSNVVVTGASGFIGSNLVGRFLDGTSSVKPQKMFALVRPESAARFRSVIDKGSNLSAISIVEGDLQDPQSLEALGKVGGLDTVYHLAAVTPEGRGKNAAIRKVNLDGTRNLFNSIRDKAGHFIYASGLAVFDPRNSPDNIVNEGSPKNTELEYIRTRLQAEDFLRENCARSGIDFTVAYFPDIVYGDGGAFRRIFLERISGGSFRVPGSGKYHVNCVHIDDAVEILVTLGRERQKTANQFFITSDSEPVQFRDFVDLIADELGTKQPGSVPPFLAKAIVGSDLIKMLMRDAKASNEKIRQLYNFRYPTYRTGIPQVVQQFRWN